MQDVGKEEVAELKKFDNESIINDLDNIKFDTSVHTLNAYLIYMYIFEIPYIFGEHIKNTENFLLLKKTMSEKSKDNLEYEYNIEKENLQKEIEDARQSNNKKKNAIESDISKNISLVDDKINFLYKEIEQISLQYKFCLSNWYYSKSKIDELVASKDDLSEFKIDQFDKFYLSEKKRLLELSVSRNQGLRNFIALVGAVLGGIFGGSSQTASIVFMGIAGGGVLGAVLGEFYNDTVADNTKAAFLSYLDKAVNVIWYNNKIKKDMLSSSRISQSGVDNSFSEIELEFSLKNKLLENNKDIEKRIIDEEYNAKANAINIAIRDDINKLEIILKKMSTVNIEFINVYRNQKIIPSIILGYTESLPSYCDNSFISKNSDIELTQTKIPIIWCFSTLKSLLIFEGSPETGHRILFENVMTQILQKIPGGKANFIFFDPRGLGSNVSKFLSLSDYSDQLITGKVWSSRDHMRARIKDLIEHIEIVTQKYLRADYADIASYNTDAEDIAEPYKILVIHDYPNNFDDDMISDLSKILENGLRCGVYVIIVTKYSSENDKNLSIKKHCLEIRAFNAKSSFAVNYFNSQLYDKYKNRIGKELNFIFEPEKQLSEDTIAAAIKKFGDESRQSVKIVSYDKLIVANGSKDDPWRFSAIDHIKLPLGPRGAKEFLQFEIGKGLLHHALVVGRPGSGKSNLFHVLITTLSQTYSPNEAQLYLIDFKKGVEFKCYADARLPHARVIAVESEREFGLSVLQKLDEELTSRGALFRKASKNSLTEYRSQFPNEALPRLILIIDEFQEFFSRRDKIETEAAIILDRLVRQGRSFGVHVILGTQTLSNSGLATSTKDQIAIRIALQCSESDSRLILDSDNTAARLLSKPGEAIYNDKAGLVEGNTLFQIAMFSEEDRISVLQRINEIAKQKNWRGRSPTIFEGHEPADLELSIANLDEQPTMLPKSDIVSVTLGEPVAIAPLLSLPFRREQGSNMILLTREENQATGAITGSLIGLLTKHSGSISRIEFVNLQPVGTDCLDLLNLYAECCNGIFSLRDKNSLKRLLPEIEGEVRRRIASGSREEKSIFLILFGIHRARELRIEELGGRSMFSFSEPNDTEGGLSKSLATILRDGSEVGIHVIVWSDALVSLEKCFDRGALSPFSLRVSGQLSFDDSRKMFDSEVASNIDKPFRMAAFDDTNLGQYTLFRPFKLPSPSFVKSLLITSEREKGEKDD